MIFEEQWNNETVINKYNNDYDKIKIIKFDTKIFNLDDLKESSLKFVNEIKKKNNLFYIYYIFKKKYLKINFFLYDLNLYLEFDYKNGITKSRNKKLKSQYCTLSSESIFQLFISGFGYDSLLLGGRYETDDLGKKALHNIFKFSIKNYQNIYYNLLDSFIRIFMKFSAGRRIFPSRK